MTPPGSLHNSFQDSPSHLLKNVPKAPSPGQDFPSTLQDLPGWSSQKAPKDRLSFPQELCRVSHGTPKQLAKVRHGLPEDYAKIPGKCPGRCSGISQGRPGDFPGNSGQKPGKSPAIS